MSLKFKEKNLIQKLEEINDEVVVEIPKKGETEPDSGQRRVEIN